MSKVVTSFAPTFLLRGIKHGKITEEYASGAFNKLTLPEMKQAKAPEVVNTEMKSFKDRDGRIICYTDSVTPAEMPKEGDCDYCRQHFTDGSVGIPIRVIQKGDVSIFYCEGIFCREQCAFAEWKKLGNGIRYKDTFYTDSEQLLRYLFWKRTGSEATLVASLDYRLIKPRGTLTPEQFHAQNPKLVRNGLVSLVQDRVIARSE